MPETEHETRYDTTSKQVTEKPPAIAPSSTGTRLPYGVAKRLVLLSLVAGLVGGGFGAYLVAHYSGGSLPASKQQLIVQESSAVVDVAHKVSPSVVSITSKTVAQGFFGQAVQQEGAGTGVIVTADGLIMTNKHVVADTAATYTVITSDGKELANAKVVARDPINDVAFVRVSATGLPAATLGDSSVVQVGQKVVAIGNALGQFQNSVTEGIISGMGRPVVAGDASSGESTETLNNLFQTDAAINPGNSGGPLLNLEGQVIGINTAVAGQNAQNIGFAIPINDLKAQLESVKSQGKIVRPYLGVRYVAITKDIASANNLKVTDGAWIKGSGQTAALIPDAPAAKAGLKDGDIITKVAGDKITATNSLQALVGKHKVGEKVKLTIVRDGKDLTIDVTLEEAPTAE
jgi:serine protease Do